VRAEIPTNQPLAPQTNQTDLLTAITSLFARPVQADHSAANLPLSPIVNFVADSNNRAGHYCVDNHF